MKTFYRASMRAAMWVALAAVTAHSATAAVGKPSRISMTPEHWQVNDGVAFSTAAEFPLGVMTVHKGVAVLKDFTLRNGTIEFDVMALGSMGAGVGFRRRDDNTYEDFYLRPRPHCETAVDCMQYAPQTHGVLLWDMFPQYQGPAPIKDGAWNHIKLVVSGRRMNIFVNGASTPTLAIARLEGDALEGGLLMQGPGSFANLVVTPDRIEGLSPEPGPDPAQRDKRFLRDWMVSSPGILAKGKEPAFADMPDAGQNWQPLSAERGGLINLSRVDGLPSGHTELGLAWLKSQVDADTAQTKHVSIGWTREIWIFVNGKMVFADKNLYQPPAARKNPDGRLSLENGSFDLPLQKGKNEIVVALADNFYGWGLEMRLEDLKGIKTSAGKSRTTLAAR